MSIRVKVNHPVRYWLQDKTDSLQNFGDFLSETLLEKLLIVPSVFSDAFHLVGSVITDHQISLDLETLNVPMDTGIVTFWCCGARSEQGLSNWARSRARFCGIRGPRSRDVIGLPYDTVMGDPGLLAPLLYPMRGPAHRRETICIVHILDPKSDSNILQETGVDRVVRAGIPGTSSSISQFMRMIANARFVLSGSLHGAIVAGAYGTPFSFYNSGYIDVPFKWLDFAESVNLPCHFASTMAEGLEIYNDITKDCYRARPLTPMLECAPFTVRPRQMLRAMYMDGLISISTLKYLLNNLQNQNKENFFISARKEYWVNNVEMFNKTLLENN